MGAVGALWVGMEWGNVIGLCGMQDIDAMR
jgi:hypothetical protein